MMRCDVVVIGGGIIGLGIARALAAAGRHVIVIEKGKVGEGASANTHRIIHGGFRYLKSLHFSRVLRSAAAQREVLNRFPTAVTPLQCLTPIQRSGLQSRFFLTPAIALYSLLTGSPAGKPTVIDHEALPTNFPNFLDMASVGALSWYDALLLDHRTIVRELSGEILRSGEIREHSMLHSVGSDNGRYLLQAGDEEISAKVVVNATGASIQSVGQHFGGSLYSEVQWCTAFNLVVPALYSGNFAYACQGEDRRLYFLVPRNDGTAIGTQYLSLQNDNFLGEVPETSIREFLDSAADACNVPGLTEARLIRIEKGILPMYPVSKRGIRLYGSDSFRTRGQYIEVLSTKYTTFLPFGAEIGRKVQWLLDR